MRSWVCRPWYDEGDGYPMEPGVPFGVAAQDQATARAAYVGAFGQLDAGDDLEIRDATEEDLSDASLRWLVRMGER